ncbi:MAG: GTP-binding protein, partial [Lachnospiraceae bacterium]|nr:GTP-binding protein [Lachnospiraceae bacterium]
QIHVIWFCIEGTRRKLFRDSIRNMLRATHMWKSIPIIVVITKSYSNAERRENVKMVRDAFEKWGKTDRLKDVIPVVAAPFVIDEDNIIPPNGIDELINTTNDLMPEAIQLSKQDVEAYILTRKRAFAQGVIATSVVAGVTATAIPVPIADGALLSAIELAEIKAVSSIYGIKRDEKSKIFISTMVEVGTVSAVARSTISMLKTIPGINIAASIMNAIIGGSFVTLIGEAATYAFEQIYLGNKTLEDTDWVKKLMETKLADDLTVKVETAIRSLPAKPTVKEISRAIGDAFKK